MTHELPLQGRGVLVLGMHRSGTSAVAACLERLGVVMGEALAAADQWNPKGYFEERRIVAFNESLLQSLGARWDSPLLPAPATSFWVRQHAPATAMLRELYAGAATWGFKDPRMCLLASFWQPVLAGLPTPPAMLLVLRHPAEVADSLARRDGIAPARAGWLWFTHLLGALHYLEAAKDSRLIDFADLLGEPARHLAGLADWLGLPEASASFECLADELIVPALAQRGSAQADALHPLVLRAYDYWRNAAHSGPFTARWLHAPEWLAIRHAFEREIRPGLEAVQQFFSDDRQATVQDARLRQTQIALAGSEHLAMARLEQIAALDAQLKRTSHALASAENLALQRLQQLQELDRQLHERSERWQQMEQALGERESTWAARVAELERLAEERLRQVQGLDQQLRQTHDAFAHAEHLALQRLAELDKIRGSM